MLEDRTKGKSNEGVVSGNGGHWRRILFNERGAAIYVNGVNTSEKKSGGGRVGSAGHIRKE